MTFTPAPARLVKVDKNVLERTIIQDFVESRFAPASGSWFVDIFANGAVMLTDPFALPVPGTLPLLSVECNGASDPLASTPSAIAPWSREEFEEWVITRNDLYLNPAVEQLFLRAHALGMELLLIVR
ncbi:MAG: hypothetical protein JNM62_11705 [Flavobacteriales bacterium]|nr:hypothetical protein [Flavobacteriales bacterium]